MTTRYKDFGVDDVADLQEVTFKLHGEEFHCRRAIQGKVLLEVAGKASSTDAGNADNIISGFFSAALVPESFERFEKLIHDPDTIVTVETLGEITAWLVEQYSERPTQESSDS